MAQNASSKKPGSPPQGQSQQQQQQAQPQQAQSQQSQQPQQQQQQRGQPKPNGPFSASDLNRIVLEYLNKKGYHRTEAMLRAESGRTLTSPNKQSPANVKTGKLPEPKTTPASVDKNAKPVSNPSIPAKRDSSSTIVSEEQLKETTSSENYIRAYSMLKNWVDSSLEIYKPELQYTLYPIFIYLFLILVSKNALHARRFFDRFSPDFKINHSSEINRLFSVNSVDHIKENEVANAFHTNRYKVTISRTTLNLLLYFLNENEGVGGSLIISAINQHLDPNVVDTVTSKDQLADGIKVIESSGNADDADINTAKVKLGPYPRDQEFSKEIETELKIRDEQEKRSDKRTLVQEYKAMNNEPYEEPAPDVKEEEREKEKEKEKETDKEKEGDENSEAKEGDDKSNNDQRTGTGETGTKEENNETAPTPKTEEKKHVVKSQQPQIEDANMESPALDALPLPPKTTLDIKLEVQRVKESRDAIKLDNLQLALPSVCMYTFHNTNRDMTSLEFSDDCRLAAAGFQDSQIKLFSLDGSPLGNKYDPELPEDATSKTLIGHSGTVYSASFSPDNRYLVSSSEDKTVRLWSLDTHSALVSYKGHNHPVWDVKFSPLGHYFATASHDHTARLWSCDHIYPLRIFAGHLNDVDCVSFHPNGCYVFTGSSDKTCRMWDIATGDCVRLFLGLTAPVISTAVSPDGRWLSTGSEDGIINVWDIGTGKRLKQMRGHGKNAIYSLAYCKEGNALVSGGADHSVRVWDLKKATTEAGPEPEQQFVGYLGDVTGSINQDIKEYGRRRTVIPTNDLVASFYTKKTPVFKVKFTRNNLALAGGAYRD
ncbi:transcription initiation factor TFIID subunit 5 [Zygosaccharomyces mellis]|uniref:Transcription initiation factor TFIID subunit 5 n=1 Tax=Zygosaccharomyces mellis TaxID=42258 RepID=A0A4C2EGI3_9SACH|nr:transcription initiation factor TFIID subunit 5 [Zygosaccharomyces mellis]